MDNTDIPLQYSIVFPHLLEKVPNKRQLMRAVSTPKELVDPWREFKNYAFPLEGRVCICRDTKRFQFVMSAFNHYECEVS